MWKSFSQYRSGVSQDSHRWIIAELWTIITAIQGVGTLENIQNSVTDMLKTIPVEDFQRCYEQLFHRRVAAQGNYFEHWCWKKIKTSVNKKSVSLLFCHTSYMCSYPDISRCWVVNDLKLAKKVSSTRDRTVIGSPKYEQNAWDEECIIVFNEVFGGPENKSMKFVTY